MVRGRGRWAVRAVGVGAVAVLVVGCSGDGADETAASPSASEVAVSGTGTGDGGEFADQVASVMADVGPRLAEARFFEQDPIADIEVPLGMFDETRAALADASDRLPSDASVPSRAVRDAYRALLDAVAAWDDDAGSAQATMEAGREELGERARAWADGPRDGPPPQEYTDLIDVNFTAAARFGEVCTAFATLVEVSMHCGEEEGAPPPEDPGEVPFTIGALDARIEPGPVTDELVERDLVGFDFGVATLTLMVPPDVAAPGSDLRDTAVEDPVPWPEDLVAWAEALGAVADPLDDLETSAGTWEVVRLTRPDEPDAVVVANPFHPSGGHLLGETNVLVVYQATIDGQPVVAILEVHGPDQVDVLRQQAGDVLATLRLAGSQA